MPYAAVVAAGLPERRAGYGGLELCAARASDDANQASRAVAVPDRIDEQTAVVGVRLGSIVFHRVRRDRWQAGQLRPRPSNTMRQPSRPSMLPRRERPHEVSSRAHARTRAKSSLEGTASPLAMIEGVGPGRGRRRRERLPLLYRAHARAREAVTRPEGTHPPRDGHDDGAGCGHPWRGNCGRDSISSSLRQGLCTGLDGGQAMDPLAAG